MSAVLLERITAGPWQTNTYVLAAGPQSPCVVIDPGFDAEPLIDVVRARHDLTPAGIVLTHGHLDHVASVPNVAASHGLTVWIHPEDEVLLSDPAAGLSPESKPLLEQFYGTAKPIFRPEKLKHINDGDEVSIGGVDLRVWHSPGHTPGCVVLTTDSERLMLSGDVLFNQGVGRTDLPRSDPAAMKTSLTRIMDTFDDGVEVYPGHGPSTTIGSERSRAIQ